MNKAVTLRELLSDRFNTGLTNLRVLKKTRDVEGAKSLSSIYTYSQQRIVLNGREVQSPIPIQREFSLFDGNGLLDAAVDDVIFVRQNLRVHVIVVADLYAECLVFGDVKKAA